MTHSHIPYEYARRGDRRGNGLVVDLTDLADVWAWHDRLPAEPRRGAGRSRTCR
ncbi:MULTISPECIES: hypothetical protein [unclassified Micromonospora]|uniref:hypothetical protein n=1 Tax=unclassified Micromonospora TaxID=2617518 RepID=UPI0033B881DA